MSCTFEQQALLRLEWLCKASTRVVISEDSVTVHFGKRAHNPFLLGADFPATDVAVPWWRDRRVRLSFG